MSQADPSEGARTATATPDHDDCAGVLARLTELEHNLCKVELLLEETLALLPPAMPKLRPGARIKRHGRLRHAVKLRVIGGGLLLLLATLSYLPPQIVPTPVRLVLEHAVTVVVDQLPDVPRPPLSLNFSPPSNGPQLAPGGAVWVSDTQGRQPVANSQQPPAVGIPSPSPTPSDLTVTRVAPVDVPAAPTPAPPAVGKTTATPPPTAVPTALPIAAPTAAPTPTPRPTPTATPASTPNPTPLPTSAPTVAVTIPDPTASPSQAAPSPTGGVASPSPSPSASVSPVPTP